MTLRHVKVQREKQSHHYLTTPAHRPLELMRHTTEVLDA
jgi:hypothetical protein